MPETYRNTTLHFPIYFTQAIQHIEFCQVAILWVDMWVDPPPLAYPMIGNHPALVVMENTALRNVDIVRVTVILDGRVDVGVE